MSELRERGRLLRWRFGWLREPGGDSRPIVVTQFVDLCVTMLTIKATERSVRIERRLLDLVERIENTLTLVNRVQTLA